MIFFYIGASFQRYFGLKKLLQKKKKNDFPIYLWVQLYSYNFKLCRVLKNYRLNFVFSRQWMWSLELYILIEASRMIFQYMIFLKNLLLLQFTFCIVLVTMTFYMWNNKNWGFKDSVLIGVEVYPKPGFFVPWINASWTWNFINFLPILWHIFNFGVHHILFTWFWTS